MAQDNGKKIEAEDAITRARFEWVGQRIRQVHKNVSAFDILSRNGVTLTSSSGREEQISCPFHGTDKKPSARIYPDTAQGPSHVWCYVCQERWDAIALWRKYQGADKDVPFTLSLTQIEQAFGLPRIPMPQEARNGGEYTESGEDPHQEVFENFLAAVERRLLIAKAAYKTLGDMKGYLSACAVIDKVSYQVAQRRLSYERAIELLRQLVTKLGEKIQACPEG